MPVVNISLVKGKAKKQKKVILNAVHKALVSAFKIPETDRTMFINEYEPENIEAGEGVILVEVKAFKGRSNDAKKELYKGIVDNLQKDAGVHPDTVMTVIHDIPREDWGIRGGRSAREVNLGLKTDV